MQGRTGPQLSSYHFVESFRALRAPHNFTAQLNGTLGGAAIMEDLFIVLLCGFDIVHVGIENQHGHSLTDANDPCSFRGHYILRHTRPFLGWLPPTPLLPELSDSMALSSSPAALGNETAKSLQSVKAIDFRQRTRSTPSAVGYPLLHVPFTSHLEGTSDGLTHFVLRTSVLERLASYEGKPTATGEGHADVVECPEVVAECLRNPEALKMLVALRRANVSPDLITTKTLLGASRQKEMWRSALSIL